MNKNIFLIPLLITAAGSAYAPLASSRYSQPDEYPQANYGYRGQQQYRSQNAPYTGPQGKMYLGSQLGGIGGNLLSELGDILDNKDLKIAGAATRSFGQSMGAVNAVRPLPQKRPPQRSPFPPKRPDPMNWDEVPVGKPQRAAPQRLPETMLPTPPAPQRFGGIKRNTPPVNTGIQEAVQDNKIGTQTKKEIGA